MNPCYMCPKREPGCHGRCEAYQTWSRERQEINQMNRDSAISTDVHDFKRRSAAKRSREYSKKRRQS